MKVDKVLVVEDSIEKYMAIFRFLQTQNVKQIEWATNAQKAIEIIDKLALADVYFDLILSDMHFDFFGNDDRNAGEKLMNLLLERGFKIPFVFCSSQNWKIEGSMGTIFYNPFRDWENDAEELFRRIRSM